jgi:hypothetical protein
MTTSWEATSWFENTSLAHKIVNRKTPIAVAIAEYIRSLIHSDPEHVYVFGKVSEWVKAQVSDITQATK